MAGFPNGSRLYNLESFAPGVNLFFCADFQPFDHMLRILFYLIYDQFHRLHGIAVGWLRINLMYIAVLFILF